MAYLDNNDFIAEVKAYITDELSSGFSDADEVEHAALDYFSEECDSEDLEALVTDLLEEVVAKLEKEQASWPEVTDCDRLDLAFEALESAGIVARQNFT